MEAAPAPPRVEMQRVLEGAKRGNWMRRITARVAATFAALAIVAVVVGCGSSGGGSTGGGTAATKGPLKIAAVKGFTGALSSFDGPPAVAAQLAVDDVNARGGILGRRVELIRVDTKTQVDQGGPAALQAIDEGAAFIIAPCDFDFGAPVAIAAQQKGVLAMSDCAGAPAFGRQGIGPLAFTMGMAGPSEGAELAEWAYHRKGLRKAYVLLDTTLEYHKQVCRGFTDRWKQLGGTIAGSDTFKNTDPSIASQLTGLQSSHPDTIVLCSFPPGGAAAIRQIRAAGVNLPILGPNSFDGEAWKKAVPNLSNVYYTNYGSLAGDDPNPKFNELVKRYTAATGQAPPNSNIVTGYSVVEALKAAAEKAGTTNGAAVAKALESFHGQPLLIGPTTFTPDLHIDLTRPILMMQIQHGRTSVVGRYALSKPPTIEF